MKALHLPLILQVVVGVLTTILMTTQVVSSAPVVDAPWGRISGIDVTSPTGVPYRAYLGIPFALPPVGERRFAKPVPHPGPGVGRVFNGSALGYICPQTELEVLASFPAQSEDCLTLNVYLPSAGSSADGLRSVMVWIYGGGYFVGSAAGYRPSRLVTEGDVIVVVIQYRLGVLGFLSSGDEAAPGNYGLFDQTLALKWVKDNIQAFGGDPSTITLFGESAGAGSIAFHLLSPYSKDLFQRGVQQSGSPLAAWAINKKPTQAFYTLARRVGCSQPMSSWTQSFCRGSGAFSGFWAGFVEFLRMKGHKDVVECLRKLPANTFVEFSTLLNEEGQLDYFDSTPWIPVVDGDFVPRPPEELLDDVNYLVANDVMSKDVMIGVNNNEGGYVLDLVPASTSGSSADNNGGEEAGESAGESAGEEGNKADDVFTAFAVFPALDERVERLALRSEISYRFPEVAGDERRLEMLVDVLTFFYLPPMVNDSATVQGIADTFADVFFTTGAVQMSRQLANAAVQRPQEASGHRYLYLFDHFPAFKAGQSLQGVNHGEDLFYQFDASPLFPKDHFNQDDRQVEDNFLAMLLDFAKNGNADKAIGRQLSGGVWPEFSLDDEIYLSLSARPSLGRELYAKRIALWLDLLPSLVRSTRPSCQRNYAGGINTELQHEH